MRFFIKTIIFFVKYIEVFRTALDIWWKNKFLWILGLLSVFADIGIIIFIYLQYSNNLGSYLVGMFSTISTQALEIRITILVFALLIVILWSVLFLLVNNFSNTASIKSSQFLNQGKTLTFKETWQYARKYWLRVLKLNTFFQFWSFLLLIVFLFSVQFIFNYFGAYNDFNFKIFALVLILLTIFSVNTIVIFAERELIIKTQRIRDSIKLAVTTIRNNVQELIIAGIVLVLGTIIFLPIFAIYFAVIGLLLFPSFQNQISLLSVNPLQAIWQFILLYFVVRILTAILQGPFEVFVRIYWTIAYLKLKYLA